MKKVEIIRKGQIDTAQKQHFRQYLTGHLQNPQPELKHIEGDIEVGISNYEQFTADTPHIHPICTEHTYVLQGSLKFLILETKEEIHLHQGDFLVLHPNTPYASKNASKTRVLFIKYPSTNDKIVIKPDEDTQQWMKTWD